MSDKRRKFIGFVLYWGIVLLLCWIGVRYVLLWLLPFLIALGLAYLMEPSVCFLREKLRLRRGFISSVLALLLLLGTGGTELLQSLPERRKISR